MRQPSDTRNNEQQIIQQGPEGAGLDRYLKSLVRVNSALGDLKRTNLRSNQQAISGLGSLLQRGNTQLEKYYADLLLADSDNRLEVLKFTMQDKPFPRLQPQTMTSLGVINNYITRSRPPGESPISKTYVKIRGDHLTNALRNSSLASLTGAKNKQQGQIYEVGKNGFDYYAKAMYGLFVAEYDNICAIFPMEDWKQILNLTCQGAIAEMSRTVRELNTIIKANLTTDCYFAYEIIEEMTKMASSLESKTGELKPLLVAAMKPVRDTGKASLGDLLEDTRRRISLLTALPIDGASVQLTAEVMARLQTMALQLGPISSILISLGDGGWRSSPQGNATGDQIPSLNSFDVTADGQQIFANYCIDTIDLLLGQLDQRAKSVLKKQTQGLFLANNAAIVERMIRGSSLEPYLAPRQKDISKWLKAGLNNYISPWDALVKATLFEQQFTNRARPNSSSGTNESLAIVKALSSKEKDSIKEKFRVFNTTFDELVAKHKTFKMEMEVKEILAKQIRETIERLYGRFWDRYREIDKGKGKHIKYDKESIAKVFASL